MRPRLFLCIIIFGLTSRADAQNDNLSRPDTSTSGAAVPASEPTYSGPIEEMPEFPGGEAALFSYLKTEQRYPLEARKKHIEGVVHTTFVLNEDGTVSNAKVLRGIGEGCDEEALRLVNSMPVWTPGKQYGRPVKVQFNLPIRFPLSKGNGKR